MKRVITLSVAAAIIILMLLLSGCNAKTEIWLKNAEIDATLREDGSAVVSERWEAVVDSSSELKNVYKTLEVEKDFDFNAFKDSFEVTNASGEEVRVMDIRDMASAPENIDPGDYSGEFAYVYRYTNGTVELGVFFEPVSSAVKDYTFSYTLENAVTGAEDVADFYWAEFGSDFQMYIENFSAEITLPGTNTADDENTRFWLHIDNAEESDSFVTEDKKIRFEAKGITPNPEAENGILIETRVLLKKDLFGSLEKRSALTFASITAQENAEYEAYLAEIKRENTIYIVLLVVGILFVLAGVGVFVYFRFFFKRYKKDDYPPYVREIPADSSAAEMGYFFYHYSGGGDAAKNRSKMISATIMELARREIVEFIPSQDEKTDCSLRIREISEAELKDMKGHEKAVYNMLFKAQTSLGKAFTMDEFSDYAKRSEQIVAADIRAFAVSASAGYKKGGYFGAIPKNYGSVTGLISCAAAFMLYMLDAQFIMMIIGLAIFRI